MHVVRSGETLTRIAQAYGVTVEAVVRANQLANADSIYAGQKLIIPPP
nr:LysM peptidoglycan-binding domain-containing protein [Chloroflexota bacterium]